MRKESFANVCRIVSNGESSKGHEMSDRSIELQQKDCELDSHEYARVDQASAKVTKGEPEEVEQHYYYSLENPEENCSDNKGKKEIINADENEYDMPQFHHLVIHDKSVAPNTDEAAKFASVKEINATPLDLEVTVPILTKLMCDFSMYT